MPIQTGIYINKSVFYIRFTFIWVNLAVNKDILDKNVFEIFLDKSIFVELALCVTSFVTFYIILLIVRKDNDYMKSAHITITLYK